MDSVDAQLNAYLGQATKEQFMLAFMHANQENGTILPTIVSALGLENKASNPVPVQVPAVAGPMPMPRAHVPPPPRVSRPSMPMQYTNYGVIPATWVIDREIVRPERLAPPPKTYADNPKLPFTDIAGSQR